VSFVSLFTWSRAISRPGAERAWSTPSWIFPRFTRSSVWRPFYRSAKPRSCSGCVSDVTACRPVPRVRPAWSTPTGLSPTGQQPTCRNPVHPSGPSVVQVTSGIENDNKARAWHRGASTTGSRISPRANEAMTCSSMRLVSVSQGASAICRPVHDLVDPAAVGPLDRRERGDRRSLGWTRAVPVGLVRACLRPPRRSRCRVGLRDRTVVAAPGRSGR
jgi:hypothetical protein